MSSMNGGEAAGGAYDTFASKYIERGLPPLPIEPGKKWPASWNGRGYTLLAGWTTKPPITTPQPGAGIGLRLGVSIGLDYVLVGLDLDDEEVAIRLLGIAPDTPARKVGQRGETWLYKAKPGAITTKRYRLGDKTIAELLAAGTQTVLPPSRHPAGMAYRWLGKSLLDVNIDELPELTPDAVANIETALRSVGWQPEPEKPAPPPPEAIDADEPFERAKTAAMRNLATWVPHLGLQKCRRRRGPHASYEAVATWRPSSTGRSLEQRAYNLKISPRGICDFGDGAKGYSAIDLVVVARGCTVSQALRWLEERLGLGTTGPEIDYDALARAPEMEKPNPESNPGGDVEAKREDGVKRRPVPPSELGEAWHFGDPAPAAQEMLVPLFVPAQGFGYIGGQWGTLKTFVTNEMAVAIASGGTFAGQQVARRGVVVQVELEGSNSEARLSAAAMIRGCERDALPIVHLTKKPPNIMESSARANPAFKVWAQLLVSYAKEMAAYYGLPLALITIDPQNKFAGFRDEQSSAEGQVVTNAFEDLARLAGCTVLVVDHFGKNAAAGLRGTSVKETNPLYMLTTGEHKTDIYARRRLEIRKMRNGRAGVATSFWAEDHEVPIQCWVKTGDEMAIKTVNVETLVLRWGDEVFAVEEGGDEDDGGKGKSKGGRPPIKQRIALRVLSELISKVEAPSSSEVSWVSLEAWYEALLDQTVIEPDDRDRRKAFQRIKDGLREKNEIKIRGDKVCIPL
jgi:hypothetical protein